MIQIAVVCAVNGSSSRPKVTKPIPQLTKRDNGFSVESYGTGSAVRLPGPSIDKQNVFTFGTPYSDMLTQLTLQDRDLYERNGLLKMLERNRLIKLAPQRFNDRLKTFALVITCTFCENVSNVGEEKCFDSVMDDIMSRPSQSAGPIHVINVEIRDTNEDSLVGAQHILELVKEISLLPDVDALLEITLNAFIEKTGINTRYCVGFN